MQIIDRNINISPQIQEMTRQHNNFFYINIYVRLHVSTIQVVIIRSLIEITGLQKAARTYWDIPIVVLTYHLLYIS